jgi:hypothetical protein
LPGDILYATVDNDGNPTGAIDSKFQLDGAGTPGWSEITKLRPYVISGADTSFNAGMAFDAGQKLQLKFGVTGATITRIGERFPDDAEKAKTVHGRAAIRRLPFDDFQSAFEKLKGQPYQRYLPNRLPLRKDQRAFYVEQVIYTNAYYARSDSKVSMNAVADVFGKDRPLTVGVDTDRGSIAYYLAPDATTVEDAAWDYESAEHQKTVFTKWVTVAVVLQPLPVQAVPVVLEATYWDNAEVESNTPNGVGNRNTHYKEVHTAATQLVLGVNSGLRVSPSSDEYKKQSACWATSTVTSSAIQSTVVGLEWSVSVDVDFGGTCGPDGSNTGGAVKVAPQLELRFYVPGGEPSARWGISCGAEASGRGGKPEQRPAAKLRLLGPGLPESGGVLVAANYEGGRATITEHSLGGVYSLVFSAPTVEQGCYGGPEGSALHASSSVKLDLLLESRH